MIVLSTWPRQLWSGQSRTKSIALWSAIGGGISALGPLIAGALLEHFWWGSVFLLAVPVMVLLLALGPVLLPEYRESDPAPLDVAGAGLLLVAMLALVYGVKDLAAHGVGPVPLVAVAAGAVVVAPRGRPRPTRRST